MVLDGAKMAQEGGEGRPKGSQRDANIELGGSFRMQQGRQNMSWILSQRIRTGVPQILGG